MILLKVNKSVYIAKSRQRYYKTLNNILLHVPNHALKDVYMLNYGTIKNTNSSYYTGFFIINFFWSYNLIKTYLVFWTFFRICPTIFEWYHGWRKRIIFKKQKFSLRGFFSQPGIAYKKACSAIEVLIGFFNSRSSQRRCSMEIGVLKKFEKFTFSFLIKLQNTSVRLLL